MKVIRASVALLAIACAGFTAGPAEARSPQAAPTSSPLPYPAYGTPAPEIARTRPVPGVPQRVSLAQAVAIAAATSPVLGSARAALESAQAAVNGAKSAIFPNVSGTGTVTRSAGGFGRTSGVAGAPGSPVGAFGNSYTQKSLDLTLRQLLFDGGKVIAQIHQARALQAAAADTYDRQLQTLAYSVAQAYYTALQARRAAQLAREIVHQNEVQEQLVRAQIAAGTEPRAALTTAQFPVAQARVALVRAQGAELSADAAFADTLGLPPDAAVVPAGDTPADPSASRLPVQPVSYAQAVNRALLLRPDYLASQYQVNAAQENLRAQHLGRFPSLTASASSGTTSTTPSGGNFRSDSSIGATLTIPIFDQGLTNYDIAAAQAALDNARAQLRGSQLAVELSVRQALVGLISARAALLQTQAELAQAREELKSTQAQYRAGVTTLPLLLNAQVALTTAQTDQLNAIYALRQAEQTYLYAMGANDLGQ